MSTKRPGSVMLVDDDAEVREAYSDYLELNDYEVQCAANGLEALRLLEDGVSPCVILLDLMMPVMDGWEFRRHLSSNERWAEIPVVVMSAHGSFDTIAAETHLRKPLDVTLLTGTVSRFCRPRLGQPYSSPSRQH